MYGDFKNHLNAQLTAIREAGTWKAERVITTPQEAHIQVASPGGGTSSTPASVLNMCANNYLGLADHPDLVKAAHAALDRWGYGLSSVRFICGTQALHKQLEAKISEFLGTEDTILYSSCFDANGGLFETLLAAEDAIISDELNHASIIDGVRLCKAQRFRYKNNDMADLEAKLRETSGMGTSSPHAAPPGARFKMIATDGVFSMDGFIANLPGVCDLAEKYNALVMVDDSHAVGFMGRTGRGTHEHHHVMDRIDIITGTLGKALGGASGGYTSGRREIIDLLRQRSRPYLFSNTLAPVIAGASLACLEMLMASTERRDTLMKNTTMFRQGLTARGFNILPGEHPIVPIMLGDAALATKFADAMLQKGVYVIGFSYPVVPQGKARIRVQVSAGHSEKDLAFALEAFAAVKKDLGI
ncbi:MAG: glycine C-acetyltransferase [Phycisphaeraceae bacterium]